MPTEREKPCAKFWSVGCCKQGLHTASIKQATYIEYWPVDPFWCGPKKRSNYIGSEGHRSYKGPQSETLADWFLVKHFRSAPNIETNSDKNWEIRQRGLSEA
eukprot:scaffold172911_cov18-Tisochrysis_lutea.AAC.1